MKITRRMVLCALSLLTMCCIFSDAVPSLVESVQWRFGRRLYDYRIYGAVTLQRFELPVHTVAANLTISLYASSSDCAVKKIKVFANQFGIPVVRRDNESFPDDTFISDVPVLNISLTSRNSSVEWTLDHLQAGALFLMFVMPRPDNRIKQKGLSRECAYYASTVAQILHHKEEEIQTLPEGLKEQIQLKKNTPTLFNFQVPEDAVSVSVEISGCGTVPCHVNVSLWDALSRQMWTRNWKDGCLWHNGTCHVQIMSPVVGSRSYLGLNASVDAAVNISIHSLYCGQKENQHSNRTTAWITKASMCRSLGELGRETPPGAEEGSNFYDHFVAWNKKTLNPSTIHMEASDVIPVVAKFRLRTSDTGTSMRVVMETEHRKHPSQAEIRLCVSPGRIQNVSDCSAGPRLSVTSLKSENKNMVIVPYPQSGVWFLTVQSHCFSHGGNSSENSSMPCDPVPKVNLSIHLSPCVNGGCGEFGTCKLYFNSDLLYSACSCNEGWRGYGCTDGSHAQSKDSQLRAVYLLTLSNLGFLPGICLALHRRYFVEALVYSYNMFFSTFYHACDTSSVYQLCILPYNALSFADFFASLLSFWVTLLAMARIPPGVRTFLHMCSALFISLGEVYNRNGLLEQLLPLVCGLVIVLVSWGVESYRRKRLFPSKHRLLKFVLPGVSLAGLGLIFNLALETEQNYQYVHSCWHLLESASILFLLPPSTTSGKKNGLSIQSGDISRQSLLANIHAADDTGQGSEPSSPPETPRSFRARAIKLVSRNRQNGGRSRSRQNENLIL